MSDVLSCLRQLGIVFFLSIFPGVFFKSFSIDYKTPPSCVFLVTSWYLLTSSMLRFTEFYTIADFSVQKHYKCLISSVIGRFRVETTELRRVHVLSSLLVVTSNHNASNKNLFFVTSDTVSNGHLWWVENKTKSDNSLCIREIAHFHSLRNSEFHTYMYICYNFWLFCDLIIYAN